MARVRRPERVGRRGLRDAVPWDNGQEHDTGRGRRQQRCDAREHGVVVAEDAPQERSPRKVHGQRVRETMQDLRRVLGRRHDEQDVRQVAPRRSARGVGHCGRIRIHTDEEGVRALRRGGEHGAAVTRPQVERHLGMATRQASDVVRMKLVDAAASHHAERSAPRCDLRIVYGDDVERFFVRGHRRSS